MARDRYILWLIISAMGLLMIAQLAGNGMLAHWRAQDERLSQPDPAAVRLLAPDR